MSTSPNHSTSGAPLTGPLVLVVAASPTRRQAIAAAFELANLSYNLAEDVDDARCILDNNQLHTYEAVIFDVPACSPAALRFVREIEQRRIAALLICPQVSFDEAVEAMRAGAADIVPTSACDRELPRRLRCAVRARRAQRASEIRAENHSAASANSLQLNPHSILPSPPPGPAEALDQLEIQDDYMDTPSSQNPLPFKPSKPAPKQPSTIKGKRATPKAEIRETAADRTPQALAAQFELLVRSELDVETLLRHVLEFVLANLGATNAAVFLPGSTGDYSLGAYVNYSCPKDAAEVLLDHLANVAAPNLEHTTGVIHIKTPEQLEARFGDSCGWIGDCEMLAFTCRSEGECLAVFTLFRERSTPFGSDAAAMLGMLSDVFGHQLARVIRIHHRHLPRDKWGSLGDPTNLDDEGGMAA